MPRVPLSPAPLGAWCARVAATRSLFTAAGRAPASLLSLQACSASRPRTCSTASSATSSPSSTSASATTPRHAAQSCLCTLPPRLAAARSGLHVVTGLAFERLSGSPCRRACLPSSRRWPLATAAAPISARACRPQRTALNAVPPAPPHRPAVCGGGPLHHQLQRGAVPRVPRPLAGHAAPGQRRVRVCGG
jgi:hypothetical protein